MKTRPATMLEKTMRNMLVLIGLCTLTLALIAAMFGLLWISRSIWHGTPTHLFLGRIFATETLLIYLYIIPMYLSVGVLSYRAIQSQHPHLWAFTLALCFMVPWLIFIHDFAVVPLLTVAGSQLANRWWGKRPGGTTTLD